MLRLEAAYKGIEIPSPILGSPLYQFQVRWKERHDIEPPRNFAASYMTFPLSLAAFPPFVSVMCTSLSPESDSISPFILPSASPRFISSSIFTCLNGLNMQRRCMASSRLVLP